MNTTLPRSQGALLLLQHIQSMGRGGLTKFAASLGLHYATVDLWLRGRTRPRTAIWHQIEHVTGGHVPATSWIAPGVAPDVAAPQN
jgi:hypothetical protein